MNSILKVMMIAAIIVAGGTHTAQATEMAQPEPDFDNPRLVVISLSEKSDTRVNAVLNNVMNVQKAYGIDNVKLAVVAYGPGIWTVLKDSPVRKRVESMLLYEVEFIACANTLDSTHKTQEDLIEGVGWARSGLVEIIERRLNGWVDLSP